MSSAILIITCSDCSENVKCHNNSKSAINTMRKTTIVHVDPIFWEGGVIKKKSNGVGNLKWNARVTLSNFCELGWTFFESLSRNPPLTWPKMDTFVQFAVDWSCVRHFQLRRKDYRGLRWDKSWSLLTLVVAVFASSISHKRLLRTRPILCPSLLTFLWRSSRPEQGSWHLNLRNNCDWELHLVAVID